MSRSKLTLSCSSSAPCSHAGTVRISIDDFEKKKIVITIIVIVHESLIKKLLLMLDFELD